MQQINNTTSLYTYILIQLHPNPTAATVPTLDTATTAPNMESESDLLKIDRL